MPDCELLSTCPFFNDKMHSEMPEMYKEQYCRRDYAWCGRYLIFKALQRNIPRQAKGSRMSDQTLFILAVALGLMLCAMGFAGILLF